MCNSTVMSFIFHPETLTAEFSYEDGGTVLTGHLRKANAELRRLIKDRKKIQEFREIFRQNRDPGLEQYTSKLIGINIKIDSLKLFLEQYKYPSAKSAIVISDEEDGEPAAVRGALAQDAAAGGGEGEEHEYKHDENSGHDLRGDEQPPAAGGAPGGDPHPDIYDLYV